MYMYMPARVLAITAYLKAAIRKRRPAYICVFVYVCQCVCISVCV